MHMFLYAYIRSMVKDRVRGENRSNFAHICARTYMARDCGALVCVHTCAQR